MARYPGAARFIRRLFFPVVRPKGLRKSHFQGFMYLLENLSLTSCYTAALMGFGWYSLLGLTADSIAFRFWYPYGPRSCLMLSLAAGLDALQDFLSHLVCHFAERRHHVPCRFNQVFPGWLQRPSTGLVPAVKVAAVVWIVPAWLTHCAFAFNALST